MSFLMRGLSPADQQKVLNLSGQVVPRLRQVAQITARGGGLDESDMWFGDSSQSWMNRVKLNLNRMASVVNLETITVIFRPIAHRKGSFAAAAPPQGGWGTYTTLQDARRRDFTLKLDTGFNEAPLWRTRTNLDSQFQTFVHEITHMLLNTDDLAVGQKRSRMLARQSSFRAKNNADNWGYFVEECIHHARTPRQEAEVDTEGLANLFG